MFNWKRERQTGTLSETIQQALRWPIACWMNRYPDTCWADLVMWAIFPTLHEFGEIFDKRYSATGCGYCGKCEEGQCLPSASG